LDDRRPCYEKETPRFLRAGVQVRRLRSAKSFATVPMAKVAAGLREAHADKPLLKLDRGRRRRVVKLKAAGWNSGLPQ